MTVRSSLRTGVFRHLRENSRPTIVGRALLPVLIVTGRSARPTGRFISPVTSKTRPLPENPTTHPHKGHS